VAEQVGGRYIAVQLTVQWGDCDPAGIVFYPRFFAWMDRVSHALERELGITRDEMLPPGTAGFPLLSAQAEFLAPALMDDVLEIRGRVSRIGRTSLALSHEIVRVSPEPEILLARGREERVFVERAPGGKLTPRPLTGEMREILGRYATAPSAPDSKPATAAGRRGGG
jgi:4-hydroxybenzoyl-CoA thioesterase